MGIWKELYKIAASSLTFTDFSNKLGARANEEHKQELLEEEIEKDLADIAEDGR